ncbi:MAG: hypothetical protein ABSC21_22530 [Terriglobia bacterium]|jgi:hypothetical protein
MGLFQARQSDQTFRERQEGNAYEVRLWEEQGLPFTQDHPQPVRVIRTQEQVTQTHYRHGRPHAPTTSQEWLCITTLPAPAFSAPQVHGLGHARWKVENNGGNDLTPNWALENGFLRACKHRPRRPSAAGPPQAVPNRGLAAVILVLCSAFVLSSAFTLRHSKIVRSYQVTREEVSRQLYRSLWRWQPPIPAPD